MFCPAGHVIFICSKQVDKTGPSPIILASTALWANFQTISGGFGEFKSWVTPYNSINEFPWTDNVFFFSYLRSALGQWRFEHTKLNMLWKTRPNFVTNLLRTVEPTVTNSGSLVCVANMECCVLVCFWSHSSGQSLHSWLRNTGECWRF